MSQRHTRTSAPLHWSRAEISGCFDRSGQTGVCAKLSGNISAFSSACTLARALPAALNLSLDLALSRRREAFLSCSRVFLPGDATQLHVLPAQRAAASQTFESVGFGLPGSPRLSWSTSQIESISYRRTTCNAHAQQPDELNTFHRRLACMWQGLR